MLLSELLAAPPRLWTVAEYAAIGETEPGYTELVGGRLLISPSPPPISGTFTSEAPFPVTVDLTRLR